MFKIKKYRKTVNMIIIENNYVLFYLSCDDFFRSYYSSLQCHVILQKRDPGAQNQS